MIFTAALLRSLLALPAAAAGSAPPEPAAAAAGPIAYEHVVRKDPPLHLHVVTVDLTDPSVSLVARRAGDDPDGPGPWHATLARTSLVAARDDLDVAVNGAPFETRDPRKVVGRKVPYVAGGWARVPGFNASDGVMWAKPVKDFRPALAVSPGNRITVVARPVQMPRDAREVVSGFNVIVADGRPFGPADDPAPRTAAGVDRAGKRLVLLVVDGRRPDYSAGLSIRALGEEMVRLGCWSAINLDGGGSSTLVLRDPDTGRHRVRNRPSDGHQLGIPLSVERPIATVLGVKLAKRPATRPAARAPAPPASAGRATNP